MGLLGWLIKQTGGHTTDPVDNYTYNRRCCVNCIHCYDKSGGGTDCSNFFASYSYTSKARNSPTSHTDCPQFSSKN